MKQKKWKQVIIILLMSFMVLTCFAGCGNGQHTLGGEDRNGQKNTGTGQENFSGQENGNGLGNVSGQENGGGKGRFLEGEIALPKGVSSVYDMRVLEDGTLAVMALNSETAAFCCYTSKDFGKTWNTRELEKHGYVAGAVFLSDGSLLEIVEKADKSETGAVKSHLYTLYKIETDGTEKKAEVTFSGKSQEEINALILGRAAVTEDDRLLMQDFLQGMIYQIDVESGEAVLLCDLERNSNYFGMAGNLVCAVTKDGVVLCDGVTGERLEPDEILNDVLKGNDVLLKVVSEDTVPLVFNRGMEEDSLLYVTHDGIFYHSLGGSVCEQLVNGALTSLSDPAAGFKKVQMLDEETILVLVCDSGGSWKIYSYIYNSSVSAMPKTELLVYALEDSKLLRQAAIACQKNYPDIYVNVQIGRSGDDSVTTEDALRTLNTEILAGKGPDVLMLDGIPVEGYMEKGILADISNVAEQVKKTNGLFENVYRAYEKDGAVYELPARFYPAIVEGDKKSVAAGASLSDLADYGVERKKAGAKYVFSYKSPVELLKRLYSISATGWTDKDGKLDAEKIMEWLTIAEKIYGVDMYGEHPDLYAMGISGEELDLIGEVSAFSILSKECEIEFGSIRTMEELIDICSANDTLGAEYDFDIVNRDDTKVFMPYGLAGIVNHTSHRTEAEQFLLTLYGTECGTIDGGGFPINRESFDNLLEAAQHKYSDSYQGGIAASTDEGVSFTLNLRNLTKEEGKKLTGMLESLKEPAPQDALMQEIVVEQAKNFLLKNQTKEETVNAILQKCNLYLSE